MPEMMTAATILYAGSSIYTAVESSKQTGIQKEALRSQESQARKKESQAAALASEEEKNRLQTIMQAQKRRGAISNEAGLRETVLTGALGLPGQPQTASKTLLGA